jgi:hypothetical protein
MKIEVLSRKDAARIRGVSERTIDRLCDMPDSGVRRVKLSLRRVGIVGARDLAQELTITEPNEPA